MATSRMGVVASEAWGMDMDLQRDSVFGRWLYRRRRFLGLSRKELAQRAGCSVSMLRKLEGEQRRPSKGLARAIANALDVDAEEQDAFVAFARAGWADRPAQAWPGGEEPWRTAPLARANGEPVGGPGESQADMAASPVGGSTRFAASPRVPAAASSSLRLVGREALLEQMDQAWKQGLTIVLAGPGGIGKTRLMRAIAEAQGRWIGMQGRPGDRLLPLSTIRRLFRWFHQTSPATVSALPPWVRAELTRVLPELSAIAPPPIESDHQRLRLFEAAHQAMVSLCKGMVTVLADDLQYYDPLSYELGAWGTAESVRRGESALNRTIAGYRPAEMPPGFQSGIESMVTAGLAVHFDVPPLNAQGVAELLRELQMPSGSVDVEEVLRITGGSPIHVIEAVKGWWETRRVAGRRDTETVPSPDPRNVILQRLDRLPAPLLRLSQAVALLGEHVTLERLAAMTDASPDTVVEQLARLEDAGILRDLHFVHDVFAENAEATMTRPRRRYLHRRAARALIDLNGEPAQVAHHLEQTGEFADAMAWRLEAAERALADGGRTEAEGWLAELLERAPQGSPLAARAAVSLGRARVHADVEGAREAFLSALEPARQLGMAAAEAAALAGLAHAEALRGDEATARAYDEEAFLIAAALESEGGASILAELSEVRWLLGDTDVSGERAERASQLAPARTDLRLGLARRLWYEGRYDDSLKELSTVLTGDPRSTRLTTVLRDLGRTCWAMGRLKAALSWLDRGLAVWAGSGDLLMEAAIREELGAAYTSDGRPGKAEEQLAMADALLRKQGAEGRLGAVAARRAYARLLVGSNADAERLCASALARPAVQENPSQQSLLLALQALADAKLGRSRQATYALDGAVALVQGLRRPLTRVQVLRWAAVAAPGAHANALARADEARRLAERHAMHEQAALAHCAVAGRAEPKEARRRARMALGLAREHHLVTARAVATQRLAELGDASLEAPARELWAKVRSDWATAAPS